MLAGEVQNSQFSSARFMKDVWPKLKAANLNTVFGSIGWEQIEPVEGTFVFDELDELILDAREHGLHLVLLWFGSYKNGESDVVDPVPGTMAC
jgi:beta-galactosidase GanA